MKINRRIATKVTLLVMLAAALSVASSRLRADTGTCGGASITLPFIDVPAANVFFCSIAEAYFSGLTNGTDATHYNPAGNVPREQMAAFVTRTLDQSLKRGSRRAALRQWATPTSVPFTGTTTVGNSPEHVECDGADLWVTNNGSDTVSRVRASDGKLLETWTGATDAFDILIARGRVFVSGHGGKIFVIDPRQPAGAVTILTSSLPVVGSGTYGMTFDGFNLWTANTSDGSISKVNPNTGAVTTFTGFTFPLGIIYDGTHLWVTENVAGTTDKIDKVDPTSGNLIQVLDVGTSPQYPVFDGTNIWVPNFASNTVTVVRVKDSVGNPLPAPPASNAPFVLATLSGNGLDGPGQAAFDGERILVPNFSGDSVSLWKANNLTPLGAFGGATGAGGACSDGINFWIVLFGNPGALARF
jgi:hypothetical protein